MGLLRRDDLAIGGSTDHAFWLSGAQVSTSVQIAKAMEPKYLPPKIVGMLRRPSNWDNVDFIEAVWRWNYVAIVYLYLSLQKFLSQKIVALDYDDVQVNLRIADADFDKIQISSIEWSSSMHFTFPERIRKGAVLKKTDAVRIQKWLHQAFRELNVALLSNFDWVPLAEISYDVDSNTVHVNEIAYDVEKFMSPNISRLRMIFGAAYSEFIEWFEMQLVRTACQMQSLNAPFDDGFSQKDNIFFGFWHLYIYHLKSMDEFMALIRSERITIDIYTVSTIIELIWIDKIRDLLFTKTPIDGQTINYLLKTHGPALRHSLLNHWYLTLG